MKAASCLPGRSGGGQCEEHNKEWCDVEVRDILWREVDHDIGNVMLGRMARWPRRASSWRQTKSREG